MITEKSLLLFKEKLNNFNIDFLGSYENIKKYSVLQFKCNRCQKQYSAQFYLFMRSKTGACPNCRKCKTDEEFKKIINDKYNGKWKVLSKYMKNDDHVLVQHLPCHSQPFYIRADSLLTKSSENTCKYCSGRYSYQFVKDTIESSGTLKLLSTEYTTNKTPLIIKCLQCENIYTTTFSNFYTDGKGRCYNCNSINRSQVELDIYDFVKSICPSAKHSMKFYYDENNRNYYYEADILIESKELVIEVDGVYWHCDEKKGKGNLKKKTDFFKNLGYNTIHIFDFEWYNNQQVIKNRIQGYLIEKKFNNPYIKNNKIFSESLQIGEFTSSGSYITNIDEYFDGNIEMILQLLKEHGYKKYILDLRYPKSISYNNCVNISEYTKSIDKYSTGKHITNCGYIIYYL